MENDKINRVLDIYDRLQEGKVIYKSEEAQRFQVNEKSIQRDIEDIREYLEQNTVERGIKNDLIYDYDKRGYRLECVSKMSFSNEEILALTKILLDSRAFTKKEMMDMLDKLLDCCVPLENRGIIDRLIANEKIHYIQPHHGKIFIDKMWEIGNAILESRYIEISYEKTKNHETVKRKVQPQAIMFSEFYFYLAAYIENIDKEKEFSVKNDIYPTIYRIDRIADIQVLDEHFKIPYRDRFEEGEYRKKIQFMYGGRIQKTVFWYKGLSVEAVLDRLPTAKILKEEDGKYLVSAETFGDGIEMWLRSQGDAVEIVQKEKNEKK